MQEKEERQSSTDTGIVFLSTNDFIGRLQKTVTKETYNCVGFYYKGIHDKTEVYLFDVLWTGNIPWYSNRTLDDLQRSNMVNRIFIKPVQNTVAFRMSIFNHISAKSANTKQLLESIFHYTGGDVPSRSKIQSILSECGEDMNDGVIELSKMSSKEVSSSPERKNETINELSSHPQLLESILNLCSHEAEWNELHRIVSTWSEQAKNKEHVVLDLNALIRLVNSKSREQIDEISEPVCATVSCSKNAKVQLQQGKEVLISSCGNGLSQLRRHELEELLEQLDDEPQFDEVRRRIVRLLAK